MGTRGLYGIRKGGVDKCTYNHFDSYPDGLGADVLQFCATHSEEQISKLFDLIEIFNTKVPPTEEQKRMCKQNGYVDLTVSNRTDEDWYCLLRELQGNIRAWDEALKQDAKIPMEDDKDFIKDSLFCEYGYIINLDTHYLEFWLGFQNEPDPNNRYGAEIYHDYSEDYYPCKLVGEFKLSDISTHNVDEFIDMMKRCADED